MARKARRKPLSLDHKGRRDVEGQAPVGSSRLEGARELLRKVDHLVSVARSTRVYGEPHADFWQLLDLVSHEM
jgi:hypothetical protein